MRSLGASIHCPDCIRALSEQLLDSHPLAVIQVARGATPIWLEPRSSPTMVPMVWVPWPTLSHGVLPSGEHTCEGSNQL